MESEILSVNSKSKSDFVPGTVNICSYEARGDHLKLRLTKNKIILVPQPSDSVNDPLNWTRGKKLWNLVLLAFITGFTAATSNDAGATQEAYNKLYGISYEAMNTGAGVLFIAIGWTAFLLTPVVSLYGRKVSYLVCIFVGLLGAVWFALGSKTSDTVWLQLFVGASEACAEAHVQQSLADMYFQHQLGAVLTVYILATSVGTYLGPLLAGLIVDRVGFRWVGWIAALISAGLIVVIIFGMHETVFDRRKYLGVVQQNSKGTFDIRLCETEKKMVYTVMERVPTGSSRESLHSDNLEAAASHRCGASESPLSYWELVAIITRAPTIIGWGFRQYLKKLVLLFRVFVFPPTLFSGLVWGMQNALLTFYITVEDDQYHDPPYNYGTTKVAIMNVPCLVGAVIGCIYAGVLSDWLVLRIAERNNGVQEAEYRLYFLLIPAILTPIGLMLFAVGTDQEWSWPATYFGLALIGVGFGSAGDVSMGYLMDAYPGMVIEMMAGVAVINNMFGCIFTFACSPWLEAIGNTRTFAVLAAITVVVMGGAVPFIIYGKDIRKWTKPWYLDYCEQRDSMG